MAQNVLTEGAFWIGGIHYVRQKYLNCSHLTESWCSFKFFVIGWLYYPAESTLVFTQLCQKEKTKTRSVKSYWMVQWYVDILLFAMCASPMIQLCLPPKFCITFVFNFPWVLRLSQEKNNEDNAHAKFWGANMAHYVRCANGKYLYFTSLPSMIVQSSFFTVIFSRKIKGPKVGCILCYMSREGGRHTPHNTKTIGWAVTAPSWIMVAKECFLHSLTLYTLLLLIRHPCLYLKLCPVDTAFVWTCIYQGVKG